MHCSEIASDYLMWCQTTRTQQNAQFREFRDKIHIEQDDNPLLLYSLLTQSANVSFKMLFAVSYK
jgi:hypothetical protein